MSTHSLPAPPPTTGLTYFTSYFLAVFNSTRGDRLRARAEFVARYGREAYEPIARRITKLGLMTIFERGDYTTDDRAVFFILALARHADRRCAARPRDEGGVRNG